MFRWLAILLALAAAAACASGPKPRAGAPAPNSSASTPAQFEPSTPYPSGDGTELEKAVVISADDEDDGLRLERRWIYEHYGKFRKKSGGLAAADGRHYDVLTVELADHSEKTIFFDITQFYGREKGRN